MDSLHSTPTWLPSKPCGMKGRSQIINGIRLPQANPVPLPQHGHLAHLRTRKDCYRRLVGPRDPRPRPPRPKRCNWRQLRPWPARSLGCPGVPVASVGNLETYGLFPDVEEERIRGLCLDAFGKMYGGTIQDSVMDYLGQTGRDALKGADILRTAPEKYSSTVEYADNPIAQSLKNAAQVMCADLGTRIYYTQHGSFDTHGDENQGPRRPMDPGFRRRERLHGRPGRTRPRRRRHCAGVDRIRPPRQGQRLRNRPRFGRNCLHLR